jgi:hypothetical protein
MVLLISLSYGPMNPANSMETPISGWKKVISWMKKGTTEDFENIISRMEKIPAMMDQFIVFLQKAIDMKTTDHEKSMVSALTSMPPRLSCMRIFQVGPLHHTASCAFRYHQKVVLLSFPMNGYVSRF